MGTTGMHREPGMTNLEFFKGEWPDFFSKHEVVAENSTRDAWYSAVRDLETGDVWAMVVKISRAPRAYMNFYYKVMDETVIPFYHDASKAVLDALTPTDNEHANEWRARVREELDAKKAKGSVKVGDKIHFKHPMTFGDGVTRQTFTLTKRQTVRNGRVTSSTLLADENGTVCRVPNWKQREFSIL